MDDWRKWVEDREHLIAYAERHFKRTGQLEWPTARAAAKALAMPQAKIEEIVEGDGLPLMLTSLLCSPPEPIGDHFVEVCR